MLGFFNSASHPIGVDLGTDAIRLVQFRNAAEGLTLQAACRIETDSLDASLSQPARLVAAIRQAQSTCPFVGKQIALSLPASCVAAKSVRLPQMPDSDLAQALQWEAKDRFGFELGDGKLVWFRVGEVRRGTEIKDELLLFAVKGEILTEFVDTLSAAKFILTAIDLAPCATFRAVRRAVPAGPAALLDVGRNSSQFMITRDDQLVFYKNIDIGGAAVNQAVAAKLGISPAEALQMRIRVAGESADALEAAPLHQALRDAMRVPIEDLAKELDMCMRYFVVTFRGTRPEAITLAGRQASCPFFRDALGSALGLQIQEAQPMSGVLELGDAVRPDRSAEWSVAAGLSLYPTAAPARSEAA